MKLLRLLKILIKEHIFQHGNSQKKNAGLIDKEDYFIEMLGKTFTQIIKITKGRSGKHGNKGLCIK